MNTLVSITQKGGLMEVELKRGQRSVKTAHPAGTPLWRALIAGMIRLRLGAWITFAVIESVFVVAIYGCFDMMTQAQALLVRALYVVIIIALAWGMVFVGILFRGTNHE